VGNEDGERGTAVQATRTFLMKKAINSSEVWNFEDPLPSTTNSSKLVRWGGEKALICLSMEVQLSASLKSPVIVIQNQCSWFFQKAMKRNTKSMFTPVERQRIPAVRNRIPGTLGSHRRNASFCSAIC
ncbi:hypothetical protein, partial [Sulfitobacter sp. S74]|uniref:hypothetical protein n=1 Tax=Sulfitobacter sp. S74 TaxID=2731181 RepID=UPI0023E1EABD